MKQKFIFFVSLFFFLTASALGQENMRTIEVTTTDLNNNVNRKLMIIDESRNVLNYVGETEFPESVENRLKQNIQERYQKGKRYSYSEYQDGTEYRFVIKPGGEGPERIVSQKRIERIEKRTIDPNGGEDKIEVVSDREYAYLGVFVQPFYYNQQNDALDVRGVKVSEVIDGEAAFNAGLRHEDVITELNGMKTPSPSLFVDAIKQLEPRKEVSFTVFRDGENMQLNAIAGVRRNNEWDEVEKFMTDKPEKALLGIHIKAVDKGARIESLEKSSAADLAGLKPGDIIFSVNGSKIKDAESLAELIEKKKIGDVLSINYRRNGKEYTTDATLQSPEELFFEDGKMEKDAQEKMRDN